MVFMKRGVVKIDRILTESDVDTDEAKAKKALADAKKSANKGDKSSVPQTQNKSEK